MMTTSGEWLKCSVESSPPGKLEYDNINWPGKQIDNKLTRPSQKSKSNEGQNHIQTAGSMFFVSVKPF